MVAHGNRKLSKNDIDVRFQRAYIYYIVDRHTSDVYVGSSFLTKAKRHGLHKSNDNKSSSKQIIERGDYVFAIVEYYPCWSKAELHQREQQHMARFWMGRNVINKVRAFASVKDCKERQHAYYEKNKAKITEYKHDWYEKNKEHSLELAKDYRENNKEAVKARKQRYYQKNKETVDNKNKAYAEKNKEKLSAYKVEWARQKRLKLKLMSQLPFFGE